MRERTKYNDALRKLCSAELIQPDSIYMFASWRLHELRALQSDEIPENKNETHEIEIDVLEYQRSHEFARFISLVT
jgi:hypothetical protein